MAVITGIFFNQPDMPGKETVDFENSYAANNIVTRATRAHIKDELIRIRNTADTIESITSTILNTLLKVIDLNVIYDRRPTSPENSARSFHLPIIVDVAL